LQFRATSVARSLPGSEFHFHGALAAININSLKCIAKQIFSEPSFEINNR